MLNRGRKAQQLKEAVGQGSEYALSAQAGWVVSINPPLATPHTKSRRTSSHNHSHLIDKEKDSEGSKGNQGGLAST